MRPRREHRRHEHHIRPPPHRRHRFRPRMRRRRPQAPSAPIMHPVRPRPAPLAARAPPPAPALARSAPLARTAAAARPPASHNAGTRSRSRAAAAASPPTTRRPDARRSSARGAGRGWRRGTTLPIARAMTTDDPAARLAGVHDQIERAKKLAGRTDAVELIAVSKTHPAEAIDAADRRGPARVRRKSRAGSAGQMAGIARGATRHPPRADRPAAIEQGGRGGGAVRPDPFGRPPVAGHRAGQGDGRGGQAPRVLRPGQYRRRAAKGRRARSPTCPRCWPRRAPPTCRSPG